MLTLVYGYMIVIGTTISCIAGTPSIRGHKSYAVFVVGRFIIGFGLASFLMTSLTMVQEITHPRTRGIVAGSWNSWYIIGMIISGWIVFGTSFMKGSWGWRLPYILQLPLAVYILIAVQFVPESPRFLLGQGKDQEAFDFLVEYHGNGNRDDPLVLFEFEEMKTAIEAERVAKAESWSVILRSKTNRKRLLLAALMTHLTQMSGTSIIYFYYSVVFDSVGITGTTQQTGINAGLNTFSWFCQIGALYGGRFFGRKTPILATWPIILLCLVGLCVAGACFTNSGGTDTRSGVATVVLVWIYLGAYNFALPVIYSYPAEVQTFSMRTKGLLVWNTLTQIQNTFVVFVDSIGYTRIGYKYYAVYMPLVIIQWFLVKFYMVETKGYTLEEVATAFDGSDVDLTAHYSGKLGDAKVDSGEAVVRAKKHRGW